MFGTLCHFFNGKTIHHFHKARKISRSTSTDRGSQFFFCISFFGTCHETATKYKHQIEKPTENGNYKKRPLYRPTFLIICLNMAVTLSKHLVTRSGATDKLRI